MTHLTKDEVEDIYLQGNFWVNDAFGSSFDYQAFAAEVLREENEKREEAIAAQCICHIEGSPCSVCSKKMR